MRTARSDVACTKCNVKNGLSKTSKRVAYHHGADRCYHDTDSTTPLHVRARQDHFAHFPRRLRVPIGFIAEISYVGYSGNKYNIEKADEVREKDGKLATSQNFIRSPRSTRCQTKTVLHHNSSPTSTKTYLHELIYVFGFEIAQSVEKPFFQTRSLAIVPFGKTCLQNVH